MNLEMGADYKTETSWPVDVPGILLYVARRAVELGVRTGVLRSTASGTDLINIKKKRVFAKILF